MVQTFFFFFLIIFELKENHIKWGSFWMTASLSPGMSCDDVTVVLEATVGRQREQMVLEDLKELRRHLCEVSLECGVTMTSLLQRFLVFKRDEVAAALASWPPRDGAETTSDVPPTTSDPFGDCSDSGSNSGDDNEEDGQCSTSSSSHLHESFDTFMTNMAGTVTPSRRRSEMPHAPTAEALADDVPPFGAPAGWFWDQCSVS
jgi:hypothetical protein